MSQKFDPMTGEPITETEETVTNKPIGFNPMTGEPIYEQQKNAEPQSEAPQTVETPVAAASEAIPQAETTQTVAPQQKPIGFDPMTGQPIYQSQQPESGLGDARFQEKKNGNKAAIIIVAIVAILAIAGIIFAGFKSGMFLSKKNKILLATSNTFSDCSHLMKDLSAANNVTTDQYSFSFDGTFSDSYDDISAQLTYATKKSDKQVYGYVDIPYVGEVDFVAEVTDKELRANIPMLTDDLLVYKYTEEPTGYIADYADPEQLTMINDLLAQLYSNEDVSEKAYKEMLKVFKDEFKDIKVENADRESFEVDGKDRKCSGYTMTITSDNIYNVVEGIVDVYAEYYEATLEEAGLSADDLYDELEYAGIDELEDVDVTFYIYKNKLASICLSYDGDELEWNFLGGARRTENMEILVDGDVILEIKGSTEKSVEEIEICADGETVAVIEYDYKNGELNVDADDSAGITFEATLEADNKGLTIEIEDFTSYYDDITLEGTFTLSKDVEFQKLTGDEFDIGNASESDWMDMAENIYNAMGY